MPRIFVALLLLAGVSMSVAPTNVEQARPTYRIGDAPAELRPAIQRADLIILSVRSALLSELARELAEGGPSVAVKACHVDTLATAHRIAHQERIAVGRTSDRLRNPLNAPPPWAAGLVEMTAGQRASSVDGFVVNLGDRVGVLRPIAEQRVCAACHGPEDKIDPQVRATVKAQYSADRAYGYREGDLRGWFWAEVPIVTGGGRIR
jgi:hypothetical protein